MMTQKHHLAEVLCAIWFDPNSNPWDSTYFGKFFEKIEKLGFTEKQEQKAVQIKVELKGNINKVASPELTEGEVKMVFKNNLENTAIILANNFISFHKLPDYKTWDSLTNDLVYPILKLYDELGLGKNIKRVQALYLNKYQLERSDKLSNYFNFIPSIEDFGIGVESNILFQSQYDLAPNLQMLIKLNGQLGINEKKEVFLECSCFANANNEHDTIQSLLKQAHDQANLVYQKIIVK